MSRPYRNRRPRIEPLERRNLLATIVGQPACVESNDCTLRQYPDVNGDGRISPIDVLMLVNFINKHGVGAPAPENPPPFVDVNEDGVVTPGDALIVVNFLNGTPSEGESLSARFAPPQDDVAQDDVAQDDVAQDGSTPSGSPLTSSEPLSRQPLARESMFSISASTAIIEETELPVTELPVTEMPVTELPVTEILNKRRDEVCSDCQDGLADEVVDGELLVAALKTHSLTNDINDFFGA